MNEPNQRDVCFGFFDPQVEIEYSERSLPHWFQPGVATFITFRTADSLPRQVIQQLDHELRDWFSLKGITAPSDVIGFDTRRLPPTTRSQFQVYRAKRWNWHLDSCHGECLLRRPELAKIVADALLYFDGERYDLDSLIVMPNHAHLLVQFRPPTTMRRQCKSWLHYTAMAINRVLGRRGKFWQAEPFDHLVRSERQFAYLQRYIAENPLKACLESGQFLYWRRT